MNNSRLVQIGKKMDMVNVLMTVAKSGLSSANKNNPFWSKSDAMSRLNSLRAMQRKLSTIWILEQKL